MTMSLSKPISENFQAAIRRCKVRRLNSAILQNLTNSESPDRANDSFQSGSGNPQNSQQKTVLAITNGI